MFWAILSILAGLGDAVSFAVIKKIKNIDASFKLMLFYAITLPFLLLGFLFYEFPAVSAYFYIILIANVVTALTAIFLLIKSLEISDLSLSIPMLSFTPLFLLVISNILLQEFPTLLGLIGIFAIVIGSYVINISSLKYGYFGPFKSILRNKGVFYMLIVAFLFSINASLSKIGINLSNPAYFMFMHYLSASIILILLFFKKSKNKKRLVKKNSKYFIIYGIAAAFSELLAATALKLAIVPYVISLKRVSVVFSVALGFLLFREKHFKEAIVGATIMFIGVLLITLS